jgi:ubiquitin-protein ligase
MAAAGGFMKRIAKNVNDAAGENGFMIAFQKVDIYDRFYVRYTPPDGLYGGITITFELILRDYPMGPPHFIVVEPVIFHPNVSDKGTVCVDFLYDKDKWSKEYTIVSMFMAFILLLNDPNANGNHMNGEASKLWRESEAAKNFDTFRQTVLKYAGYPMDLDTRADRSRVIEKKVMDSKFNNWFKAPYLVVYTPDTSSKVLPSSNDTKKKLANKFQKAKVVKQKPKVVVAKKVQDDDDSDSSSDSSSSSTSSSSDG